MKTDLPMFLLLVLECRFYLIFNNLVNQEILPLEREQPPCHNDKIKAIDDLDRFPRPTTLPATYLQLFILIDKLFHTIKKYILTVPSPIIMSHQRWDFSCVSSLPVNSSKQSGQRRSPTIGNLIITTPSFLVMGGCSWIVAAAEVEGSSCVGTRGLCMGGYDPSGNDISTPP
ncbi:hypothetical protein CEXT_166161 [Caerostris extrusa]|uniref:Uncharacterized protein n=1 Tax=Caerostris extrusa TaxID=172846 RepID=A0AAV4QJI8_CAEEX|nr:hypothetical protein CEXT_166161 [Caerostris extrusa]